MEKQLYNRRDPYSKLEFVTSRSNQKFANRSNQIKYNNRKATEKKITTEPNPVAQPRYLTFEPIQPKQVSKDFIIGLLLAAGIVGFILGANS
jgi:hypothetical protein